MENYKCLDCDNEFTITLDDEDLIPHIQFCPFCGEESIVKSEMVKYE